MTRFRAAGIHLALSALIVLSVLALMFFVWYPYGMFKLLGGSELVYLIAGVDLTLGPLLTLIVFKSGKKTLKFDLAVIGIIQLAALIYGANVMFKSRPVFNVLENDVFKVTLASEFKDDVELLKAKKTEWQKRSWFGPQLVAAEAPTDEKGKQELVIAALSGLDWNHFPKLYVDYDSKRQTALKNAKPLSTLRNLTARATQPSSSNQTSSTQASSNQANINELSEKKAKNNAAIDAFVKSKNQPESDFVYLPIVFGYKDMSAVLSAKNADFIEIIDAQSND